VLLRVRHRRVPRDEPAPLQHVPPPRLRAVLLRRRGGHRSPPLQTLRAAGSGTGSCGGPSDRSRGGERSRNPETRLRSRPPRARVMWPTMLLYNRVQRGGAEWLTRREGGLAGRKCAPVKNLIQFFNLRRVWWDTRAVALASKVTRTIKRHCTYYQLPKPFVVVRRNTTNGRSNCRGKNAATKGGFVAPKPLPVPSRPRIIVLR
jgi:hypothetical protein